MLVDHLADVDLDLYSIVNYKHHQLYIYSRSLPDCLYMYVYTRYMYYPDPNVCVIKHLQK